MIKRQTTLPSKPMFTLLLGVVLSLAIFVSPYQLHYTPESISPKNTLANTEHSEHSSHQHHHEDTPDTHCLRCVLYGFQLPETVTPFTVILTVLGFLKVTKPLQPFSFITLGKLARAPPH